MYIDKGFWFYAAALRWQHNETVGFSHGAQNSRALRAGSLVIHRVGEIQINEPIVLVAVWSAHRAPAFEACRFIVEDLKSRAPFWKREFLDEGIRWVEENTRR